MDSHEDFDVKTTFPTSNLFETFKSFIKANSHIKAKENKTILIKLLTKIVSQYATTFFSNKMKNSLHIKTKFYSNNFLNVKFKYFLSMSWFSNLKKRDTVIKITTKFNIFEVKL